MGATVMTTDDEDDDASILEQIKALWATLDKDGRNQHLFWTLHQCATCGRAGATNGFWCDPCCEEGRAPGRSDPDREGE
jgi:hypothetical protein